MNRPVLAMVMCIRDEADFLPYHLAYHHALGVTRAYVFLDRCADATATVLGSFPWARAVDADRVPDVESLPVYQQRCADRALEMARAEGIDWLMHLDADEFAWGDNPAPAGGLLSLWRRRPGVLERGSLTAMLARVKRRTEMVRLRTKEVVPLRQGDGRPFWESQHFQDRGVVSRPLLDPVTGAVRPLARWLGHCLGKSIVRTTADVQAAGPHRWARRPGGAGPAEPAAEWRGWHYHYVVVGARHWRDKYRKLASCPERWPQGQPVPFPKQCWKVASLRLSEEDARAYYDEWVVLRAQDLEAGLARGIIVRDATVEAVLAGAGALRLVPLAA